MKPFKITQSITDRQDASLGIFLKEVAKIPMLNAEQEKELSEKIKNGDIDATNKLVASNLRFVVSVAKQYQNKGLPLVDLVQAGCLGALEASTRWDANRGYKFISYAVWWIRQSIMQAISSECRTVRIPMNQVVYMNKINKAIEKFEQEYGRKPSIEELENETKISSDKIALNMEAINRTLSLDMPFKEEDANSLLDIIPDNNSTSSDNSVMQESISKEIDMVLSYLSNRESDIIKMSFGLSMSPMPNEEIAARFGIGTERVRQIQHEAIIKLRTNYGNTLKELL